MYSKTTLFKPDEIRPEDGTLVEDGERETEGSQPLAAPAKLRSYVLSQYVRPSSCNYS